METLVGTLMFVLPLNIAAALVTNTACLDSYRVFTGDILSLSWNVVAFKQEKDNFKQEKDNDVIVDRMFDILIALPALVKYSFRDNFDITKVKGKREDVLFATSTGGGDVQKLWDKRGMGMGIVDVCFLKLLDYQKELTSASGGEGAQSSWKLFESAQSSGGEGAQSSWKLFESVQSSWERAYSGWLKMGNLNALTIPTSFTYVIQFALLLKVALLPFVLKSQGVHAIWQSGLIAYFFFGLNLAGYTIMNAFTKGVEGFATVTATQQKSTQALQQVWSTRSEIYKKSSQSSKSSSQSSKSSFQGYSQQLIL